MADGDAPAIAAGPGLGDDCRQSGVFRIEVEIEVEIDIDAKGLRQIEDQPHVFLRLGVGVGATADQIGAALQRRLQQAIGFHLLRQALLGEGADFEVDGEGVVALQLQDGVEGAQAGARIDLDEGAHLVGAMENRLLQHASGPGVDVVRGEPGLGFRGFPHRLGERALADGAAFENAGLVEVNVGIDEAGKRHRPAGVLHQHASVFDEADAGDPAIGDGDIHRLRPARQPGVADDQVKRHAAPSRVTHGIVAVGTIARRRRVSTMKGFEGRHGRGDHRLGMLLGGGTRRHQPVADFAEHRRTIDGDDLPPFDH